MPRHLIKRYTPDPAVLKEHKHLRHLGEWLHDENLWHLNRRSVSRGVAAGLFWAMIPIPMQMLAAAFSAVLFRFNLPIAVVLVWLTNPITMPPIFYASYLVGNWLLGAPPDTGEFQMSVEWITAELGAIWKPLYLGGLVLGIVLGIAGYFTMRLYWRWHVVRRYKDRVHRKAGIQPAKRHEGDRP